MFSLVPTGVKAACAKTAVPMQQVANKVANFFISFFLSY